MSKYAFEEPEMNEKVEKTNQSEDEMNAYRILSERHLNDDRLMGERSSIFLASSSILFLGFVMLLSSAEKFPIFVAFIGIILCVLAIVSNRRTSRGLGFWEKGEKRIEKEGQIFAYMMEKKIAPHLVYKVTDKGWLGWLRNRHIYAYWLPSLFIALWIGSIVWVILFN